MHLSTNQRSAYVACGCIPMSSMKTTTVSLVDCASCKKTQAYQNLVKRGNLAAASLNAFTVTDVMLDALFERINEEADERGYCDDYDELMNSMIEGVHYPMGYKPPKRTKTFYVSSNGYEIEAVDAEEAYTKLIEDLRHFVAVEER